MRRVGTGVGRLLRVGGSTSAQLLRPRSRQRPAVWSTARKAEQLELHTASPGQIALSTLVAPNESYSA